MSSDSVARCYFDMKMGWICWVCVWYVSGMTLVCPWYPSGISIGCKLLTRMDLAETPSPRPPSNPGLPPVACRLQVASTPLLFFYIMI
jgi:hypothetical protein